MRLVRHSKNELVLVHRPVLLCAALATLTLVLLGITIWNASQAEWLKAGLGLLCTVALMLPALWFAAERVDVRFDDGVGEVTISTRQFRGNSVETHDLSAVKRAMVQTHKGPNDSSDAHRVALELHPGGADNRLALTTGYASGKGAAEIVARINTWLDAQRSPHDA